MALRATIAAFVAAAVWTTPPAGADQTAPELTGLFAALRASADPREAVQVEHQIWTFWMEHTDPRAHDSMQAGIRALAERDYPQALAVFDQLVSEYPGFAEAWNKRATVHYLLGNDEASVADIVETLELEPRHFGALSGLALIYGRHDQPAAAASALRRALAVHPQMEGGERRLQLLEEAAGPSI